MIVQPTAVRDAPHQIQVLVKQALESRLAANIPDVDLRQFERQIPIGQNMRRARLGLTAEAIPHLDGYDFYLSSAVDLQAEADRTARDVFFIIVDQPSIEGDTATISIGSDVVLPRNPKRGKLCCCVGTSRFHKNGAWTFDKWLSLVCS